MHIPADAILVPDAHLLFSGDFKRSGVDLIISNHDRDLLLHNYFNGEKRAALASPDGAHLTGTIVDALTGYTQYAQADGSAVAAKVIGSVTKLSGTATIIRNGVSIILNQGDNVHKGDVIQSGQDSTLGITFIDGTVFGLSSNARMVLNEMIYDPSGSNNSSLLSLVAGTISFVAGQTAKHGDMKIDTPVATMGIRGTAVLVQIDFSVADPGQTIDPNSTPSANFQVLVEPDGTTGSYILFDKITQDPIATVNQAGQQININHGQISITNAPLSADLQKLINDVFTLKFTDNSDTKTFQHFTDTVIPLPFQSTQQVFAEFISHPLNVINATGTAISSNQPDTGLFIFGVKIVDVIPVVNKPNFIIGNQVLISDSNPNDVILPYVPGSAAIFSVTGPSILPVGLDLAKLVTVDPATGAIHYDPALFAFLGANQNVVITIGFDSMAGSDVLQETLSVTITGTNAAPTIVSTLTTATGAIVEIPGVTGSTAIKSAAGSIAFADINIGDTHAVIQAVPTITWSAGVLNADQLAAIANGGTLTLTETDSTGTGAGSVAWNYSAQDKTFDFLAPGETLTLTYPVTINDGEGGSAIENIVVTFTGTFHAPTLSTTNGAFVALPATENATIDHASGTITFGEVELTNRPSISAQFTSFTYQNASHVDVTSSLTNQQLNAIAAVEANLELTPSAANANDGSAGWSYDVVNSKFNFLGAGETLQLTYTATVDNGQGGTVSQPFAVTVTGTNDVPTIAATSAAFTELPGNDNGTIDHAGGTITFNDPNLTDKLTVTAEFSSFICENASGEDVTSSLTAQQQAEIAAVEATLTVTPSIANANSGSVNWSYDVVDSKFHFLAPGETLQVNYTATVDDGHGGVASQPFSVAITGTNDVPDIVAETNPFIEAVVAVNSGGPILLDPGLNLNSLGFNTETFDSQLAGSALNNGAGFGDFFSTALDAEFSGTGGAGVVNGTSNVTAAPFVGPLPGSADTTNYLSINGGTETITFANQENSFGLYWGSVDSYNSVQFYEGTTLVASYSGADLNGLQADGNLTSFESARYVEFSGLGSFDKVVLQSAQAFEIDNISAGYIHSQLAPASAAPITGTLTVVDVDVGDTLTGAVTGNATVELNGSTNLPTGADFSSLTAAGAVSFDSVTGDGGPETLNWTYDPVDSDLDFLKAGDTLTITYNAQVNNGFGNVGSQPLTVTIVGASPSANVSQFPIFSGSSQIETFQNVGNGVTIFGGGGQDNFVFNPGFTSAKIVDFDVNSDTINISHTLFASVSAILASAQPANSGHDTIISDIAHDSLTLTGVTVAQIMAHPGDFHLI